MKIKTGCTAFLLTAALGLFPFTGNAAVYAAEAGISETEISEAGISETGISEAGIFETEIPEAVILNRADGEYSIGVELFGGSGKAAVSSPALMIVRDGAAYAQLEWSSSNYDYMIVGDTKYLPMNEDGNSVFEIPITVFDEETSVIADTTAMGAPHEITYSLIFYSDSIGSKGQLPKVAAKRVLGVAFLIIVVGGVLNHYVKKKREEL